MDANADAGRCEVCVRCPSYHSAHVVVEERDVLLEHSGFGCRIGALQSGPSLSLFGMQLTFLFLTLRLASLLMRWNRKHDGRSRCCSQVAGITAPLIRLKGLPIMLGF